MLPSNTQVPVQPTAIIVHEIHEVQVSNYDAANESRVSMRNHTPNGADYADFMTKKMQDDLESIGTNIKQHEDNLKFLKNQKNQLEDSIVDLQATGMGRLNNVTCLPWSRSCKSDVNLGKYLSPSPPELEEPAHGRSEEEIVEQILKLDKSAAGVLCLLNTRHSSQATHNILTQDVVGVVATLGKVEDEDLSRLLSEYLGLETMLAIVCNSYKGMRDLELYDCAGSINEISALHGLGASVGRELRGRFRVICLENLRPYTGEMLSDDPQRRLDFIKPRLPNGDIPAGFLGYAVNMITLDPINLQFFTCRGYGIRETLFYYLFSHLQVYRTRLEMLQALPLVNDGAISLDGGMIRKPGDFSFGSREDVDVIFPQYSRRLDLRREYLEIDRQLKQKKLERDITDEDMKREEALLDQAKFEFQVKKQEFVKFLAESSSYPFNKTVNDGAQNQQP